MMRSILLRAFLMFIPYSASAYGVSLDSSISATRLIDMTQNQAFKSELQVAPLLVQPVYSLKGFQREARVRFITDGTVRTDFGNQDFSIAESCASLGYKVKASSCASGTYAGKRCPYGDEYVDKCYGATDWCKNNGYAVTACALPAYPAEACPYDGKYFKKCQKDNGRACEDNEYYVSCPTGKVTDETVICPYDGSYKGCVCNPCEGYDYTAAEANAQGYHASTLVCNSCGTIKYKRVENSCNGYKECTYGGEGTDSCWRGETHLFKTCKAEGRENKCKLTVCPEGRFCEYEACSQKWCDLGCNVGTTDLETLCTRPETDCKKLGYFRTAKECGNSYRLACPFNKDVFHCF